MENWNGEAYLIAPPSADGFKFILNMDHRLSREMISDSADMERFIMLFLHRYPALPLVIAEALPEPKPALPAGSQQSANGASGVASNGVEVEAEVGDVIVPSEGAGTRSADLTAAPSGKDDENGVGA